MLFIHQYKIVNHQKRYCRTSRNHLCWLQLWSDPCLIVTTAIKTVQNEGPIHMYISGLCLSIKYRLYRVQTGGLTLLPDVQLALILLLFHLYHITLTQLIKYSFVWKWWHLMYNLSDGKWHNWQNKLWQGIANGKTRKCLSLLSCLIMVLKCQSVLCSHVYKISNFNNSVISGGIFKWFQQ